MEKFLVEVTDESKIGFVKELLSSFDYLKVKPKKSSKLKEKNIEKLRADLKESFNEVELHIQGKKQLKSLDDFLNEL